MALPKHGRFACSQRIGKDEVNFDLTGDKGSELPEVDKEFFSFLTQ
jgi:hypothetical protein